MSSAGDFDNNTERDKNNNIVESKIVAKAPALLYLYQATIATCNLGKMPKQQTEEYGWPAVPRNRSNIPSEGSARTESVNVRFEDIWPKTEVVQKASDYVKQRLPQETYNHSLRVYCYGK